MNESLEINFDGLVGPTHNYAGLSIGNLASQEHKGKTAYPRAAALQGLRKMRQIASFGIPQGVLPPHARPDLEWLRRVGFWGSDAQVVAKAARHAPELLAAAYSSASMWAANLGTFSPSTDTVDGRAHFTPANMASTPHRSQECETTQDLIFALLPAPSLFGHHPPLPHNTLLRDEGAANHNRFCADWKGPGVELFVYGKGIAPSAPQPKHLPARQSEHASRAIARLHRLHEERLLFAQQNPSAIDAGCFHNDVCATAHRSLFFLHEKAFVNQKKLLQTLNERVECICGVALEIEEVAEARLPLEEARRTYLFNSQILTTPEGGTLLLAPIECRNSEVVHDYLRELVDSSFPIEEVHFCDVSESMQNGGGPACLRLRLVLNPEEFEAIHPACLLDELLYQQLCSWVEEHYREELSPEDLADPQLIIEAQTALDQLTEILDLGPLYPFQRE